MTTGTNDTGTESVVGDGCNSGVKSGALMVQGCFETDPAAIVNFTSDELLSINAGGKLTADDKALSYLRVSLAEATSFRSWC